MCVTGHYSSGWVRAFIKAPVFFLSILTESHPQCFSCFDMKFSIAPLLALLSVIPAAMALPEPVAVREAELPPPILWSGAKKSRDLAKRDNAAVVEVDAPWDNTPSTLISPFTATQTPTLPQSTVIRECLSFVHGVTNPN
jgi:hypothetical protein